MLSAAIDQGHKDRAMRRPPRRRHRDFSGRTRKPTWVSCFSVGANGPPKSRRSSFGSTDDGSSAGVSVRQKRPARNPRARASSTSRRKMSTACERAVERPGRRVLRQTTARTTAPSSSSASARDAYENQAPAVLPCLGATPRLRSGDNTVRTWYVPHCSTDANVPHWGTADKSIQT